MSLRGSSRGGSLRVGGSLRGGGGGRGGRGGGHRGREAEPEMLGGGNLLFEPYDEIVPPTPSLAVKAAEDAIVNSKSLSFKSLALTDNPIFPSRPGYGTSGASVILRTNYFHVIPESRQVLYRYVVQFNPVAASQRKERRLFALLFESPVFEAVRKSVATDYRSIVISPEELLLGGDAGRFVITYRDADEAAPRPNAAQHTVSIQENGTLGVAELMQYLASTERDASYDRLEEMTQALNIIMTRHANKDPGIVPLSGNKFFPISGSSKVLPGGIVAIRGYYTSVRRATLRVLLNLNVCTAAFYQSIVLSELMVRHQNESVEGGLLTWGKVEHFIVKVRVETTYLKNNAGQSIRKFKTVVGLAREPQKKWGNSLEVEFDSEYGIISVEAFFKKKHGIILQRPEIPVVNVGTKDKPCYLPPELCNVLEGQVVKKKLHERQTKKMMDCACKPPATNALQIVSEGLRVVGMAGGDNAALAAFGIRVTPKMITVHGRVLNPPTVRYYNRKEITVGPSGAWNMANTKFLGFAQLARWSFMRIIIEKDPRNPFSGDSLQQKLGEFLSELKKAGLRVQPHAPRGGYSVVLSSNLNDEANKEKLSVGFRTAKDAGLRFLLVILPNVNRLTYARVKRLGDVQYGIHTVCVVADSFKTKGAKYMANVGLKINIKMGGVNQGIDTAALPLVRDGKTMFVGIDVTHPSPESSEGAPSIAGVVANIDCKLAQWPASIRIQEGRKEMVEELEKMITERLIAWRRSNDNQLPKNIMVYRDGVSEGQYETVLAEELPYIRKACERIYPPKGPKPKVTIVIVGKRHHTRFYPVSIGNADVGVGNPRRGTVVDRGVTYERKWDFFLQAHHGLKGTARPAHYVVVLDEIGLAANTLEHLTNSLCYMFGRSTTAVSICPPAYYADILCERGRCYIYEVYSGDSSTHTSDKEKTKATRAETWRKAMEDWGTGVHPNLKDTMFYI